MMKDKSAKKIIKELIALEKSGFSVSEIIEKFSKSEVSNSQLLASLKILNIEKEKVFPDKDVYHRLLQKTNVTNQNSVRYSSQEEVKGRKTNFLLNLNNFFMTFNPKVITAVSLVVVLGGVFAVWQMSPTFSPDQIDKNAQQQDVDLSEYTPATVVAVKDIDVIVDSEVNDAIDEIAISSDEEMDIYIADAESESLSDLEQLYDAYEL